jgi:hypothetical protein
MELDQPYVSASPTQHTRHEIGGALHNVHTSEFPLPPSMTDPSTGAWRGLLPSHPPAMSQATVAPNEPSSTSNEGESYHKAECPWCGRAAPRYDVQSPGNDILSELSESGRQWKLDLAHFYFAAGSQDDAWKIYDEVLQQSQQCSDLTRLLIAARLLQFAATPDQYLAARSRLVNLRLSDEDNPTTGPEALWLMHLFLAIVRQAEGARSQAATHLQSAVKLCEKAVGAAHPGRDLRAHQALILKVDENLRQNKIEPDIKSILLPLSLNAYHAALFPEKSMGILLEWCMKQVVDGDYHVMLGFLCEKVLTKAPDLASLKAFENTVLFCFLWQKYIVAREALSETVVQVVEDIEKRLQIPTPMIFSTVASMGSNTEIASFPLTHSFGVGLVAERAVSNLTRLATVEPGYLSLLVSVHPAVNIFITTWASSISKIAVIEPHKQEYQLLVQNIVRHFAHRQLPSELWKSSFLQPTREDEAYASETCLLPDTEGKIFEAAADDITPPPDLSQSGTPTAEQRPMTAVLDHPIGSRPQSSVSVDTCATPRSSFTSSKASLRSLQRLGQVAQNLLKRGGSGANQLPSEAMDRDSHSSWSLRRLTGVSYLSSSSEATADRQSVQDIIMEETDNWI